MATAYLQGNRFVRGLARAAGVDRKTAYRAINVGYPQHEWPPLLERAKFYDAQHRAADDAADPKRAQQARDFVTMRKEWLNIALGVRGMIAKAILVLQRHVDSSTAVVVRPQRQVHYEEVLDGKGRVVRRIPRTLTVDVAQAPSIHAIADSVSQLAGALDKVGGGELGQLNAKPPREAAGERSGKKLTDEQIQYMAENGGRPPPGVTLEDLKAMLGEA